MGGGHYSKKANRCFSGNRRRKLVGEALGDISVDICILELIRLYPLYFLLHASQFHLGVYVHEILQILQEILLSAGYHADELLNKAQRQDIKDQLRANTDRYRSFV